MSHRQQGAVDAARSAGDVRGRLAVLERRVRAAVEGRQAQDPRPDDPFRGLYVTHDQAVELLERPRSDADPIDVDDLTAGDGRLAILASGFGLEGVDIELLVIALAPDVDPRFERLYGYLHDDVSRRRATIGLALELAGLAPDDGVARARLAGVGPLVRRGLIVVEDAERPFLARSLRVPDRLTAFLLGDDAPGADLEPVIDTTISPDLRSTPVGLARAIASGVLLSYLRETSGSAAATSAVSAVALVGLGALRRALIRRPPASGRAGESHPRACRRRQLRASR